MPYIPKQEWDALKEKVRIAHDVALQSREIAKEIDQLRVKDHDKLADSTEEWAEKFRASVEATLDKMREEYTGYFNDRFDDIRRASVDRQVQVDAMALAMRHLKLSGEEVGVDIVRNLSTIYADHIQHQVEPRELLLEPIEPNDPVLSPVEPDDLTTGIAQPDGFVRSGLTEKDLDQHNGDSDPSSSDVFGGVKIVEDPTMRPNEWRVEPDLDQEEPEHDSKREAIEMVITMFREVESKGEQLYYAPLHRAIDYLAHVTGYDEEDVPLDEAQAAFAKEQSPERDDDVLDREASEWWFHHNKIARWVASTTLYGDTEPVGPVFVLLADDRRSIPALRAYANAWERDNAVLARDIDQHADRWVQRLNRKADGQ